MTISLASFTYPSGRYCLKSSDVLTMYGSVIVPEPVTPASWLAVTVNTAVFDVTEAFELLIRHL